VFTQYFLRTAFKELHIPLHLMAVSARRVFGLLLLPESDESSRVGSIFLVSRAKKVSQNDIRHPRAFSSMDHGDRVDRRIYRIHCTFNLPEY
jgi:hypothetical protein